MHESNSEHTCMPLQLRNTGAAPPRTAAATAPSLDPLTLSPSQVPPPVTYCVRERQQPIRTRKRQEPIRTRTRQGHKAPAPSPAYVLCRTHTAHAHACAASGYEPPINRGTPPASPRHAATDTTAETPPQGPRRPLACTHTPRQTCAGGETVSSLCVRPAQLSVIPSLHPGPRFFCEGRAQTGPHAAGPAPPHRAHRQWRSGAAPVVCCLFLWAVAPAATVAARVAWCPRRGAVM